jgi:hypothetical protein
MARPDLRAAGEHLEKGIERYGDGDLVAAAVEFEEALRLAPDHARARQYLAWVRDVLAGTRGTGGSKNLDEDAVRAVTEALDADEEEAPWKPVSPTPPSAPQHTVPFGLDEAMAVRVRGTAPTELALSLHSDPLIDPNLAEPQMTQPQIALTPARLTSSSSQPKLAPPKPTSSPTIVGIGPAESRLRPGEETVTREFRGGTPTLHNLPPLDVPELTEEQVAELISLEASLPTTGPGGRPLTNELAAPPGLPTEQDIEIIVETPPPRRAPDEKPQLKLRAVPLRSDYDPELDPTKARQPTRKPTVLNPLPVDEPPDLQDSPDETTNPFVRQKLADYAPKPTIHDIMGQAKRVMDNGDPQTAVDIADEVVTEAGGIDAETCSPYLPLLEKIYQSLIGPFDRVPHHGESIPDLDPRAAFLLSRIDGSITVDDLLDVSGMPRLEAMRVLALLIRHGAIVTS